MQKFKGNTVQNRIFFQVVHLIPTCKECNCGDIIEICMKLGEINL